MAGLEQAPRQIPEPASEAVTSVELQITQTEVITSPERPRKRLKRRIIIAGQEKAGKSTIADMLGELYGVDVIKVGKQFRDEIGDETQITERDPEIDRRKDSKQSKMYRTNSVEIDEARLGPMLAVEERRKRRIARESALKNGLPIPDEIEFVTILITAPKETRMRRAWREKVRKEKLAGIPQAQQSTLPQVKREENARAQTDLRHWRALHPKLLGKNDSPFDPNFKDRDGHSVYDLEVPTGERTAEEAVEYIDRVLTQMGFVEEIKETLPSSGDIFKSKEIKEASLKVGAAPPKNIAEVDAIARLVEPRIDLPHTGGEPISRRPQPDLHPDHPSRKRSDQEVVA